MRTTYHIQLDSHHSMCGRRSGTPGGKIYPGVKVHRWDWYASHRYPEAVAKVMCKQCQHILFPR